MALFFLAGLAGCVAPPEPADVERRRALDRVLEGLVEERVVPGVSVSILEGDRQVYSAARGHARLDPPLEVEPSTRFDLASISKTFAASAAMKLVDRGALDLDDPVANYLPELAAADDPLRVHHLLSQSAGLPELFSLPGYEALAGSEGGGSVLPGVMAEIARAPRRFSPGETWSYSNSNYAAVARVVERVSGSPYDRFLGEQVLGPAGLAAIQPCAAIASEPPGPAKLYQRTEGGPFSPVVLDGYRATYTGFGELCGAAEDLARFFRALGSGRIVSKEGFRRMSAPTSVRVGGTAPYGFGLSLLPVAGRSAISHTGSSGTAAAYFPDSETTIVVLSNRDLSFAEESLKRIARAHWALPDPPPLDGAPPTPDEVERFTGTFDDGLFRLTVSERDGALWLDNPPFGAPRRLARVRTGRFASIEEPEGIALELPDPARHPGADLLFDWAGMRSFPRRVPVSPGVEP